MRNIVGQTPRGEDFFPREGIINRIYRRLESGAHVFLAAPRRVGKTSIMRFLEDNPRPGFHFVYVMTESVDNVEAFYQKLLEEVLKSNAISRLSKQKENISDLVKRVIGRVERVKFPFLEIDIQKSQDKETFQAAFEELISKYEDKEETLVVMIDEFPQTVENIKAKHGKEEAEKFLRLSREQRQQANPKVRFIFTGSIGLPAVVKKLTSTSVINDLNVIEILPLSTSEATEFTSLLLANYKVEYQPEMIDYLLDSIKWLIPFHLQLAVQELIDVYESTSEPLDRSAVDKAFSQLLNVRNDIYFEHYYSRLTDAFAEPQRQFALTVLDELAQQGTLTQKAVHEIAGTFSLGEEYHTVLESLMYDGYIHFDESQKIYRFNSYLLQRWWNKKNPH